MMKAYTIDQEMYTERNDLSLMSRLAAWAALAGLVLLGMSCAGPKRQTVPLPQTSLPEQGVLFRLSVEEKERLLLAPKEQAALAQRFRDDFFRPWRKSASDYSGEEATWGVSLWANRTVFRENLLPAPPEWLGELEQEADQEGFPSMHSPGIALSHIDLRVLPTEKPLFYDPEEAGEGFPFDLLQHSRLFVGSPVFVSHRSRTGAWLFVESGWVAGWVPAREIGLLTAENIASVETLPLAAVTEEFTPLRTRDGETTATGRIGMLLPLAGTEDDDVLVLVPRANGNGTVFTTCSLSGKSGAPWPPPMTTGRVAGFIEAMLGQAYGWGGMYGNRDCSSFIQDLLAPFGVPMPRHSSDQAKAGAYIDLSGYDAERKAERIAALGVPYATLLSMRGHVMLYIGTSPQGLLAVHSVWGLRRQTPNGAGRAIIGRTVVTALDTGKEDEAVLRAGGLLIERITGMTQYLPLSSP